VLPLEHAGEHGPEQVHGAQEIGLHHVVELPVGQVEEVSRHDHAGVADQHVDREPGQGGRELRVDGRPVAQVERQGPHRFGARGDRVQLGLRLGQLGLVAGDEEQVRAVPAQEPGRGQADAARPAVTRTRSFRK